MEISLIDLENSKTLLHCLQEKKELKIEIKGSFSEIKAALNAAREKIEPFPLKCYLEEASENSCRLHILRDKNDPTYSLANRADQSRFSRKKLIDAIYKWFTGKYSIIALILGFSFRGFTTKLTEWLETIASTIFAPLENKAWLTWAGIILLGYTVIYWMANFKKHPSKLPSFLLTTFTVAYCYYRFCNDSFDFFTFCSSPFAFGDLLLVNFVLLLSTIAHHGITGWRKALENSGKTNDASKQSLSSKLKSTIKQILERIRRKWKEAFFIPTDAQKSVKGFKQTPFIADDPITTSQADLLNRGRFARSIADKVKNSTTENSFAIAIFDEWGNGKTSFMNLIERELIAQQEPIIVKFYPWFSEKKEKILLDFFDALHQEAGVYDAKLGSELLKYAKKISSLSKDTFTAAATSLAELFTNPDIYHHYQQINQKIKALGRKIVVFIDDLDRLHNEEVIEVLRIIRNTSNFHNTFFIVAADQNYLTKALEESKLHSPEKYHEKVFQLEYRLPPIPDDVLLQYLEDKLLEHKYHDAPEINKVIKKEVEDFFDFSRDKGSLEGITDLINKKLFSTYFKNFRDVNRFLNAFFQYYFALAEEVVFSDFFYVTLLRVKYHDVYVELTNTPLKYLAFSTGENLTALKIKKEEVNNRNEKQLPIPLFELLKKRKLEEAEPLLKKIFEDYQNKGLGSIRYDAKRRESHIQKHFEKSVLNEINLRLYFQDGFLTGTISYTEFKSLFHFDDQQTLINLIDDLPEDVREQFFLRTKAFKPKVEDFQSYRKWYLTSLYVSYKVNFIDIDAYRLSMLSFGSGLIRKTIKGEISRYSFDQLTDEQKKTLFNDFNETATQQPMSFLAKFAWSVFQLRREFFYDGSNFRLAEVDNIEIFIGKQELLDASLSLLKKGIEKAKYRNSSAMRELFELQDACVKDIKNNLSILDERVFPIMKEVAENNAKDFLLHTIIKNPQSSKTIYFFRVWTAETFGGKRNDYTGFEEFLEKLPNSDIVDAAKALYEKFKANSYQPVALEEELSGKLEKLIFDCDREYLEQQQK